MFALSMETMLQLITLISLHLENPLGSLKKLMTQFHLFLASSIKKLIIRTSTTTINMKGKVKSFQPALTPKLITEMRLLINEPKV